jgi:hypothetical protein
MGASRGGMRNRAQLRLIAAWRGSGWLVWAGSDIPATYELDLYTSGPTHIANGNLDGDFSGLPERSESDDPVAAGARVRLDNGREFAVDLIVVETDRVEFEISNEADLATAAAHAHPSHRKA